MCARMLDRIANLSAELDDGLVHLGLDLLFEHDLAALEDFLNMRAQFTRIRIDNREFLFNAQSKRVLLHEQRKKTSADFADLHRLFPEARNRFCLQSAKICATCG